jgi:hypothetical protein
VRKRDNAGSKLGSGWREQLEAAFRQTVAEIRHERLESVMDALRPRCQDRI